MRIRWSKHPERDRALRRALLDPTLDTWDKVGQAVGLSGGACRQYAIRKGYPGVETPRAIERSRHVEPVIQGLAEPRVEPAALWEQVEQATERDVRRHQAERMVDVRIDDDRPIAISFISDQHIRQTGPVMVRQMREDAELIAATDGLYAVLGGDGVDNHIKHREAMANGGDKPAASWRLYNHYLGMFEPAEGPSKLLAVVSGNHDDWTRDMTGVDRVADLAEQHRVFYSPDEALLRLTVGEQGYRILMRHQFYMNSRMNLGHAVKRMWEMGNDDFDVGVVGHHHEPACEPFIKHGLRRYALRPGSYQVTSSYARRKGFALSAPTCPTVILWPNRREVFGVWDVRQAAGYLNWLRECWPDSDLTFAA